MATYRVEAPNRSIVNVSCKLGNFTYMHNDVMYDDKLAGFFPSIFKKISDGIPQAIADQIREASQEVIVPEETISVPEEIVPEIPTQEEPVQDMDYEDDTQEDGESEEEAPVEGQPEVVKVGKKRGRKPKNRK